MGHAEKLIARILFLEGVPIVSRLKSLHIGETVEMQFKKDVQAEYDAVTAYTEAIKITVDVADFGTRELLESILKDEEMHVDWLEAQQDQIAQIGIKTYLVEQID
jgi:bacterioferritin